MATVTMPDGSVVDMPDQLDPALGARLRAFQSNYKPPPTAPAETTAGDVVKGVGDAALSGVSKVATGIVGAPISLANRLIAGLSGGDNQAAADAAHEYVNRTFGHDTQTPVGKKIGAAVAGALAPLGQSAQGIEQLLEQGGEKVGIPAATTHANLSMTGDIAGTAGLAAPVAAGANASSEAAAQAAQNAPGWASRGFRSAADHPVAAGAAGPSGMQALTLQNQQVGDTALGAEAGVSPGTELNHDTIEAGRTAADSVKGRVAAALPTAPLSPAATAMVNKVNPRSLMVGAPDVQALIEAQKQKLLAGDLSGPDVVDTTRALRQEGYARIGSENVDQQKVGKAQVQMARALEQHIEDTLPQDADVSMDQWRQARVVQAKSSALQAALKGNNVDLQAIGRMGRADPGYLTGAFKDASDFANEHPAVSGLANKIEVPPSFGRDLGEAMRSGGLPQDILSRLFGASGVSAGARRVLTGNPANALGAAGKTPVAGLAGEFGPIDRTPQSPPGMTASSPAAPAPQAAGPPGQIPLADLLAHGVEQQPAAGLSLAPTPGAASGVPFARNAAHEAGEFSLTDELAGGAPRENNSDLGPVMSQGVPEDIMQRTPPQGPRPESGTLARIRRQ